MDVAPKFWKHLCCRTEKQVKMDACSRDHLCRLRLQVLIDGFAPAFSTFE